MSPNRLSNTVIAADFRSLVVRSSTLDTIKDLKSNLNIKRLAQSNQLVYNSSSEGYWMLEV